MSAPATTISNRFRAAAAFVLGLASILGALAFEHIGGLYPCPLCLEQRWPYYVGLPLLALAVALWTRLTTMIRVGLMGLTAALFTWGAGLGVYHSGVEWGWWPGPQSCAGVGDDTISLDALSNMSNVRIVPCDAVQFELLGISLAGFNALISAAIVVLLIVSITNEIRRRPV